MSNSEILQQNNQKLAELAETLSQKTLSQVPAGGTTDQILAKASDADYDTKWVDAPSGGGEKLYQHTIKQNDNICVIINNSQELFTIATLNSYLYNNGFTSTTKLYPAKWNKSTGNNLIIAKGIYATSETQTSIKTNMSNYRFTISDNSISIGKTGVDDESTSAITDTVTEL